MINEQRTKKYCENYQSIENYQLAIEDNTQTWHCHHRREIDEHKSQQQLKDEGLYYNVDATELIFLTNSDHRKLHNKGKQLSKETKKKLSDAKKGKQFTEEHKKKLSENHAKFWKGKQFTEEHKKKIGEASKGENNGMFGKHHSEETKRKMSEAHKRNKYSGRN